MAYDQTLAGRIRDELESERGITEKEMFGGIAFLVDGKMFVGVSGDDLMARIGPEAYPAALKERHVREMRFTGKPFVGYVFVGPTAIADEQALRRWIGMSLTFVRTVKKGPKRPRKKG